MLYTSELLTWIPDDARGEVADFLSESVSLFERLLEKARREVRHKRARLGVLRLETDRLREDAEQWGEIVNRDSPGLEGREARRTLIEKSRGLAVLSKLCEMLERDLATLEPRVEEDGATIRELRQKLHPKPRAVASDEPPFGTPIQLQAPPR